MVRAHPDPPLSEDRGRKTEDRKTERHEAVRVLPSSVLRLLSSDKGGVAQLGEHLLCKQGVIGSIPFTSTTSGVRRQKTVDSDQ
jgi:hypothetical protein